MYKIISHLCRWVHNILSRFWLHWNRILHKTLIIESEYGGLGDHLFLSHIPRIAKQSGLYKKVLFSTKSVIRDPSLRSLIWESNPYLDGFIDKHGFVILPPHSSPSPRKKLFEVFYKFGLENRITHIRPGCNLLDEIMIGYGLDDKKRFHDPEIYCDIPAIECLEKSVVYDPNFATNVGFISSLDVEQYFASNNIYIDFQMAQRNNSIEINQKTTVINSKSLLDFCSIIKSCKEIYCFTTGTATLASALKKPCNVLYGEGINPNYHHSELHKYIKI